MSPAPTSTSRPPPLDRYQGCLLGLALGDALGAPHEGGPLERLVWRIIGKTRDGHRRWTDDTQMTLDLADSLLACGHLDPDDAAQRFASSYRYSRGYGPAAAKLLKRIRRGADWRTANRASYPEGSFGVGGAMRAPVIGLFYAQRLPELLDAARRQAAITHAHPQGIEGAVAIACATASALRGESSHQVLSAASAACTLDPFGDRLQTATIWLTTAPAPSPREVAQTLGNGMAAAESAVTAIYLAARFLNAPFTDLIDFTIACGGDTDTLASMASAIWGAANGRDALPTQDLATLEQRQRLLDTAKRLYQAASAGVPLD